METLKRDWEERLTLRDVLVVISCLLVVPNEDSALNAEAGAALREGWEVFVRRAEIWTRIHAGVPRELKEKVEEARGRGEEAQEEAATRRRCRRRHITPSPSNRFPAPSAGDDVFADETTPPPRLQRCRRTTSSDLGFPDTEEGNGEEADNQENDESRSPMKRKTAPPFTTTHGPAAGDTPRRPPGTKVVPLGELILRDDASDSDSGDGEEAEYPPSPRKNRSPGKNASSRPPSPHIDDNHDDEVLYASDRPESSRAARNRHQHRRRGLDDGHTTPPANLFYRPLAANSPYVCEAEEMPSPRRGGVVDRISATASTNMRSGPVGGLFVGTGRAGGCGIFKLRRAPSPAEKKQRQAELSARLWVLCGGDVERWNRGDFGGRVIGGRKGGRW